MFPPEGPTTARDLNQLSEQPTAGEALAAVRAANAQPTQAELEAAGQQTLNIPAADVAQSVQAQLPWKGHNRQP